VQPNGVFISGIYIYIFNYFQKYTTISKFYSFDNHSPWIMAVRQSPWATTVADDGCSAPDGGMKPPCNRSGPRQLVF
jgi:hypothetical protein